VGIENPVQVHDIELGNDRMNIRISSKPSGEPWLYLDHRKIPIVSDSRRMRKHCDFVSFGRQSSG
jgi:hypothetical protein